VYTKFRPILYFFKSFFALSVGAGTVLVASGGLLFWGLNLSLPPIKNFNAKVRTPSVTIQAIDGTVIANYGDLYDEFLNVSDLPPHVVNALLAVEDKRFYAHNGIDIVGLGRAIIQNLKANRVVQGGSTLTQQLAKNMLMSNGFYSVNDRSIRRKLQELILAIKLESRFSKNEILTIYLNRVYFGAATYGIDAASRRYFNKSGKELTLFEAAILAGLLRAPSRFSPTANPKRSVARAKLVLASMESSGFIDASWRGEIDEWEKSFVNVVPSTEKGSKYFADWVFESIPSIIGPIDQDLTVVTTLHPDMQHQAEEVCAKYYKDFAGEYKFSQVALIAMTPQGAVLAMVGGLDYGKSQFNRATSAHRQPGSAFKTFVYLAALEAGIDKDEKFEDSAFEQGTWKPGNYKWREQGEISMTEAYVHSVNSVCVRVAKKVGIRNVIKTARRLGITSPLNADLTLALGSSDLTFIELVRAYAPFFNNGYICWAHGISEIRDKNGEILYQRSKEMDVCVIDEQSLESMRSMMRAVVARGTGRAANVDPHVMGKTGSNSNRDAWFLGGIEASEEGQSENGSGGDGRQGGNDGGARGNDIGSGGNYGRNIRNESDDGEIGEMSSQAIAKKKGIVLGVWVGNDSLGKMATISVGGRIPTRIAGSLLTTYLKSKNPEQTPDEAKVGAQGAGNARSAVSSVNQLLNFKIKTSPNNGKSTSAVNELNSKVTGGPYALSSEANGWAKGSVNAWGSNDANDWGNDEASVLAGDEQDSASFEEVEQPGAAGKLFDESQAIWIS
jgi:penicillin-binding protein 1A